MKMKSLNSSRAEVELIMRFTAFTDLLGLLLLLLLLPLLLCLFDLLLLLLLFKSLHHSGSLNLFEHGQQVQGCLSVSDAWRVL